MKVIKHNRIHHQPKRIPRINRRAEHGIDHIRPLEQRQNGPLMVIIIHMAIRPRINPNLEQPLDLKPETLIRHRTRIPQPIRIRNHRRPKRTNLRERPRNRHGQRGGEDQPWCAAECALCDGREGGVGLAGAREPERLQCADEAREKCEDGHADAALPGNAQNRPLQHAGCRAFVVVLW